MPLVKDCEVDGAEGPVSVTDAQRREVFDVRDELRAETNAFDQGRL